MSILILAATLAFAAQDVQIIEKDRQSGYADSGTKVMADQASFDGFWSRYFPGKAAPIIDFARESAIGIVIGGVSGDHEIEIVSVSRSAAGAVVVYRLAGEGRTKDVATHLLVARAAKSLGGIDLQAAGNAPGTPGKTPGFLFLGCQRTVGDCQAFLRLGYNPVRWEMDPKTCLHRFSQLYCEGKPSKK